MSRTTQLQPPIAGKALYQDDVDTKFAAQRLDVFKNEILRAFPIGTRFRVLRFTYHPNLWTALSQEVQCLRTFTLQAIIRWACRTSTRRYAWRVDTQKNSVVLFDYQFSHEPRAMRLTWFQTLLPTNPS